MKILQIYKDYYPPVKGGIEGHLHLLCHGLKRRGIKVRVLVCNTCAKGSREVLDGIEVTKVPQAGRISSAPIAPAFPYWLRRMGRWADLLHFHFPNPTAEASLLVSGLRTPTVVSYHSDIVRQAILGRFYAPFLDRFLRRVSVILVATPNYLKTSTVLRPFRDKCRIVPYGVDLDRFAAADPSTPAVQRIRDRYGDRLLLFVGRFRYYKGLDVLIDAMPDIRGRLLIVGTGPLAPRLQLQAAQLGVSDRVVFLGELADGALVHYLHACDVFVLPSNFRSEAFGIVQLEAMACRKPLLCTEIGTGTSYVNRHNETGLVVPPDDPGAMAQAANRLLDDTLLRKRFGQASYARVRSHFEIEGMVDAVAQVYRTQIEPR